MMQVGRITAEEVTLVLSWEAVGFIFHSLPEDRFTRDFARLVWNPMYDARMVEDQT